MKILYITFVDFDSLTSGSSVRPKKLYDAFIKKGHEVKLLTGLQNRKIERWKNCYKFFKDIKKEKYDLCYIEPPAGPIFNFCDHLLMLYIAKIKKIPMGIFYRDAYWKFAKWNDVGNKLKTLVIKYMHIFDLQIIKATCSKVYFPSKMMADLFEIKGKDTLPPGCEDIKVIKDENISGIQLVYVGGMNEQYGGQLLLESLEKVNSKKRVNLHLVCRKDDIKYLEKYKDKEWLTVYHASGEELINIYAKGNVAIIPRKIDLYMNFAMPIKLLEYVTFEMPIISTNCTEVANFINSNNIGLVCEDNVESIATVLENITEEQLKLYNDNIIKAKKNNTWEKRVDKILELST